MKYFDEHPRMVRFLVGVLTVYLFVLAVVTFYRYTSAPTDENWFRDSKSTLYVIKGFSATAVTKSSNQPFTSYSGTAADSIRVGDLVMRMNDIAPRSQADIDNIMRSTASDSVFTIVVDRSTENAKIVFKAKRSAIPGGDYVRTIPPTAYVYDVIENGASDRAGMKVGDLILRINGKGFENVGEASLILSQGQIGKSIEYEVLRANKILTLNVTLASWGLPISFLIVFMSGLLYMTVGVFIAMKRPQLKAARLTGLAFLALGFVMVVILLQGNISNDFFVRLRSITMAFSIFFGIGLLFHSRHYFPKERPELLARPWIRGISYVLAVSSIVVAFIWKGSSALIGVAAMMLYFTGITIYFWKQCSLEYKKSARLISWTGIVSFGLAIAMGFLINATQNQAYFGYIGAVLALFPLSYLYSIGRYRLLDLDLRVRRNIQYSIISWVWIFVLAALSFEVLVTLPQAKMNLPNIRLTGASIEILNTPSLPGEQEPFEKAVLMATAVLLTLVVGFVGKRGQAIIDRMYDRARYDYRRAANELAEVMGTKLGMVDLARGIVEKLSELMKLKRAGVIFFRDECSCCCTETQGFDGTAWKNFCMMSDKKLVEAIQKFKGEFSVDYLPTALKENFRQQEFQYVIPVRSKEKLIGALFVGEKLSESTFRQEDLELLSSTAKQASVAIENAFLYEELAQQERIKHELDMARRIQEGLLPKKNPTMKGLDISGISIPAMSVGGDYFDYIPLGRKKLLVVVADVSGKGMSAALYMSKIQGMVQLAAHMYKTPKEMLIHINRRIFEGLERKSFITMILAVFDLQKKEVRICRAGHNKALISTNGKLHYMNAHGIGLGLERGKIFEEELQEIRKPLSKDGIFVFYSDGLTEAMDGQNNQFGEETVHSIVESGRHLRAEELQHSILSSVDKFRGGAEPHDDLTLVVVKTAK